MTHNIALTAAEFKSKFELIKDTPYLALVGEPWGVCHEYFGENWLHYNCTALYLLFFLDMLTSSLVPIRPYPEPPEQPVVLEVEEFTPPEGPYAFPFVTYTHHLYVYPKTLKYDGQKSFAKARNIACYVEIRDSDEDRAVPLKVRELVSYR